MEFMSTHIGRFKIEDKSQVDEIFFESSDKKEFKNEEERDLFYQKYLGFYLDRYPELALVAKSEGVLGYTVGALDSNDSELQRLQPHLNLFQEYFDKFPAHLHINCHAMSRGMGIGSLLIETLEKLLESQGVIGYHIMTSPTAKSRDFYRKLGLNFEVVREFKGSQILFMGKTF